MDNYYFTYFSIHTSEAVYIISQKKKKAATAFILGILLIPFSFAFTDRLFSNETIDNDICDDGEYVFLDCNLNIETMLNEMWLLRVLLFLTIIFAFYNKEFVPITAIIFVVLLVYNGAFGETVVEEVVPVSNAGCWGEQFIENAGRCILPSHPNAGWILIAILIIFIVYRLFRIPKHI